MRTRVFFFVAVISALHCEVFFAYPYSRILPSRFIEQSLKLWKNESPQGTLRTSIPRWFVSEEELQILNKPTYDLHLFGLYARLWGGEGFAARHETFTLLAILPWNEASRRLEFRELPEAHRALWGWVMDQEDASIAPHEFLAKTLSLSDGYVFKALLLGWDFLSAGWHEGVAARLCREKRLGPLLGPCGDLDRERYDKTRKLADMPRVEGDHFASWYHFWGVMLASYFHCSRFFGLPIVPELLVSSVVVVEEGFHLLNLFPFMEPYSSVARAQIDLEGAAAGRSLYRLATKVRKGSRDPRQFSDRPYVVAEAIPFKSGVRNLLLPCMEALRRVPVEASET